MNAQTYLFFDGCCEEAIEFYVEVFGAELKFLLRYQDGPKELMPAGWENRVFHATLALGETMLNLSDAAENGSRFASFALLVHVDTAEIAERVFELLRANGDVKVPLAPNFWALRYGIVKDRFGITWKIQANRPAD